MTNQWWPGGNARQPLGPQAREAQRPDRRPLGTSRAGVGPAPAQGTFIGRVVVIFNGPGLFIYNGPPAHGNPPVLWAVPPGVTTDPYTNTVTPVLGVGTPGGPGLQVDQLGDLTLTGPDASSIALQPEANVAFSLTSALTGVMQTLMSMVTLDTNETQAGVVSGIVLGSGATAKMGTLITSPYAAEGMGLLLQAQNDGATDVPYGTFGTVSTQGGVLTFTPVFAILPGAVLLYSGASAISVATRTSGSGTIPVPAASTGTATGQAWGSGNKGGEVIAGTGGGAGGGAGGYSTSSFAVTPSGTVSFSVAAANSAVNTTLAALTAGPGTAAAGTTPGTGGAGSTANGGAGASPSGSTGGNGGNCPSGGLGGRGGASGVAGSAGAAPGGGGGGSGKGNSLTASGAAGQVRMTFPLTSPAIIASIAAAAGTDQFGTAYSAGTILPGPADGNQYNAGPNVVVLAATFTVNSTTAQTVLSHAVGIGTYDIEVWLVTQNTTVNDPATWAFTGPAAAAAPQLVDFQFTPTGASQSVNYAASGTYTSAFNGAGPVGNQRVHGKATVKFTAAGTLALTGKESVAGNTITVSAGSSMKITPVVAT